VEVLKLLPGPGVVGVLLAGVVLLPDLHLQFLETKVKIYRGSMLRNLECFRLECAKKGDLIFKNASELPTRSDHSIGF
jgi:hypothetical protein